MLATSVSYCTTHARSLGHPAAAREFLLPAIWVQEHGGDPVIPFSGAFEAKLFDMPDDEKEAYTKEVNQTGNEKK